MGNYWSATAPRVAWDRDGSILNYWPQTNIITRLPQAAMSWLNSESGDNTSATPQTQWNTGAAIASFNALAVIFPFPRDFYAGFTFGPTAPPVGSVWQTSHNTTNGLDGDWNTITPILDATFVKPYYRTATSIVQPPLTADTLNCRGVRLWMGTAAPGSSSTIRAFHIYGWPSAGATTERVEFWHPTSNVQLPANAFDFADFPRSTSDDATFRIKNLSGTKTANNVVLQPEAPSDTSPTVLGTLSIGNPSGTFSTTQTIATLAPGAISGVHTLRRTTPSSAQLSTWTARVDSTVTTWT